MKRTIGSLLSRPRSSRLPSRDRWSLDMSDIAVYAIGDVHGCLDALLALEEAILSDAAKLPGEKLVVTLGDYVDRGPDSAGVIEHLLAKPPGGLHRICLAGNHEMAMLDYLEGRIARADWMRLGGDATLLSYGIDQNHMERLSGGDDGRHDELIRAVVPDSHLAFLRALPVLVEAPDYIFVHAGLKPGVAVADQTDRDLTTIRREFLDGADRLDRFVVHGHTPITEPKLEGRRLNLDTGCYFSGRLSAVRIWKNTGRFLSSK